MLHASFPASAVGVEGDDMVSAACGRARVCQRVSHLRGGGAGRVSEREKKWTRSRSSGRKKYHTLSKKKQGENVDKKKRAPSNSRTTTTLSLSLHLDLHRAATMHARVLSSSAGAPAATRGGGHVKVGFNVLIQSAPWISPLRPLSRSAFPVLSPAIALIHIRGHFLFHTPCSQGEARTRDEQENLHETREGIGLCRWSFRRGGKIKAKRFFCPRPLSPHALSPPPRLPRTDQKNPENAKSSHLLRPFDL